MASPDVCVVVLDSMRRDRTALYGHDRPTTPELDALADRATVYEHAYTPAPWTLPSHCSMFTGLFPSEHGVTNGFTDRAIGLPDSVRTVTQRLAERGYRTAGFSNNPWVGRLSGLDRGFDEFVEWNLELSATSGAPIHRTRDRVYSKASALLGHAARQPLFLVKRPFFTANLVDRARRWVAADGTDPTFTFLNLMEAHSPYFPPRRAFRSLGLSPPGPVEPRVMNTKLLGYTMGRLELDDERRRRALEFYDACLRYQDEQLGALVETLKREGRYEDTLLVVCADHGKTLGEYDREGSPPHYLRRLNTRVPLVVKYPEQETGERVDRPVELTDLFELVDGGGDSPLEAWSDGTALTEDFLPHTGSTATDVTRWRSLSTCDHTLLRAETDETYLLDHTEGERVRQGAAARSVTVGGGGDGHDADGDSDSDRRLADHLDDRVVALAAGRAREEASSDDLRGDVESQLRDLGYI
jgi:choline-sulfatase